MKKLPIIGIIGSHIDPHTNLVAPLGQYIATHHYHLLTGGGGGVMSAVAEAFTQTPERDGLSIGIIPIEDKADLQSLRHFTNHYCELPIITQLTDKALRGNAPMSLNTVNILTSDVIIILPGFAGTKTETSMALLYEKPVIFYGPKEAFVDFPSAPMRASSIGEIHLFITQELKKKPLRA